MLPTVFTRNFSLLLFNYSKAGKIFILFAAFYLVLLAVVVFYRSGARNSILVDVFDSAQTEKSQVELEAFERVEFRNARPVWFMKANQAKYFFLAKH